MPPRRPAAPSAPVHVIAGSDGYLAEQALERILQEAVGAERTDSVQVFRGDEVSWTRVLDAARTGSLFVPRRAVVVRNAEALKGEGEDLDAWLSAPGDDVTLVLLAGKPDKRRVVWKKLLQAGTLHEAEPLKGRALRAYVAEEVRRRGLRVREDATLELLDRVGQDLRRVMGELDKLEAFAAGSPRPLTAEDVAAVSGRGGARPLYKLTDALAGRQAGAALAMVEEVLEEGEAALRVLSALHRALRQVRGARALREARASRETVISRLGLLPFKVGDVLEASRRWSDEDLAAAFVALDRADRRVKSGIEPKVALAAAIAEACAGPGKARTLSPPPRLGR